MRSTETRVSELEKRAGTDAKTQTVWVVAFERPGPDGAINDEPIGYAAMGEDGLRWDRQPGETLEQLKEAGNARGAAQCLRCSGAAGVLR